MDSKTTPTRPGRVAGIDLPVGDIPTVPVPVYTLARCRVHIERMLAAQGDSAERELIWLQHQLAEIERDAQR